MWDFQNHGIEASDIEEEWGYIRRYLNLRFPRARTNLHCRAYTSLHQRQAAHELARLGFEVFEGLFDADSQIINDAQVICLERPSRTIFVLVTDDGNFSEFLIGLKQSEVDAYVLGTDECSERLRRAVRNGGFVPWDAPFVITECIEVIRELKGKPISRAEFGSNCKSRLEEDEIYPDDVGFSRRNPYGSLLRWLEAQGIVEMTKVRGKSDSVVIRLVH